MNYSSTWSISFLTIKTTALFIHSSALIKITTQKSFDLKVLLLLNAAVTDHSDLQPRGTCGSTKSLLYWGYTAGLQPRKTFGGVKGDFYLSLVKKYHCERQPFPFCSAPGPTLTTPNMVWKFILQDETALNFRAFQAYISTHGSQAIAAGDPKHF